MLAHGARVALGAFGLALAILCTGCAWRERPAIASTVIEASTTPPAAIANAPAIEAAPSARLAPAISNEPEDFRCLDGSWLRVRYSAPRDTVNISLNGGPAVAMHRADEAGLTSYRAAGLVFRRSGLRVAVASDDASATVRRGDTLGLIALRTYGDRTLALEIARLNRIENPDLIFPGQVLTLPRVEHRCRRAQYQEASYAVGGDQPRALQRTLFSPPSARQPDLRRVQATATDPPSP